ncbi:hypothetical protein B4U79_07801 [Dinothrombium tinctorium]|uniref:Succinate-semialdehyde dehydrogenase, mitochondrial n=1 Tax=Dinothrombium tinctorium TaxID=1965070 RepID=A0A3S3P4S7_9ACAR|nr:hypothetical protein B4U79_05579 [Dinothrombium tinctorium]RWS08404.1 hypothetical protein B4U79_03133 [Dinothrombium tinctorium]RWS10174.1 hypothetical protein B4U79_07801 [Dinothrombium tinctorium]
MFKFNASVCRHSFRKFSTDVSSFLTNKVFIDGKWVSALNGKTFLVYNPSNGEILHEAAECTHEDASIAIQAATEAFKSWRLTTAKYRSDLLRKLWSKQMKAHKALAQLMSLEMGKPLKESMGEIVYGASFLEWFAEEARRINGEVLQSPQKNKMMMYVKEPIGPVGIITPWNFPNAMITRKLAAALAAGCTVVIRPAEDSPFSGLALAKLADEVGFPSGVINVITSSRNNASAIGTTLCHSHDIRGISFTGSTAVGKLLLRESVSTVKRVSLELGGNAPFIVFNSADVSKAVDGCIASKFRNTGQTCVCANRIFVQSKIHDEFVEALVSKMSQELIIGSPTDESTTLGPLVNERAVEKVERHIKDATQKGAKIKTGGKHLKNCFFEPTVLTGAHQQMLLASEETFGPVAAIFKFDTEEEVIKMANAERNGLAGYFYSNDISQIWRVARHLEVGMIGVNEGIISSCEAPFGGVKESGLGREGSKFGIDEFINIKYVCIGNLSD